MRSKHPVKEEEEGVEEEEEQPEVKRLKFLKDGEVGAEEDDDEEEDEEEDEAEADETAAVETLRPALAESSLDAQQARAQSSASPDKQRHKELGEEEEEEDSVPAGSAADCQDQGKAAILSHFECVCLSMLLARPSPHIIGIYQA